ncbi:MAG: 2-hydroxyacid dehydrogenase [Tepidiformaceae bacterium]
MGTPPLPRACIALPVPPETESRLREACAIELVSSPGLPAALAVAEGVLCTNQVPVDEAFFDLAPNLRVVSGFGVGYNNVDLEAATRRGILICNTPGVLTDAVADLTMGLILAFSRRLIENDIFVHSRQWGVAPLPPFGFDLRGKTLGLIGFGRIGQAVAQRARPFGLEIIFHDVFVGSPRGYEDCSQCSFDDLLRRSDIVSIHTNLTPETHHRISERELRQMKATSLLVNTSRGAVVDQVALAAALRAGEIAGAALDVLEVEPPDPADPLLDLPNVIALPHAGSATAETRAAMLELAVTNLIEALSGRVPPACVNPEVLPRALNQRPTSV